jgi:DNA-binding PadR family transcriptional regulator
MIDMGGAHAMGAPWLRFAGRCNPEFGRELSDWLAKMAGHHGPRGQEAWGQWGTFGGPGFGPWGGPGRTWRAPKARRGDIRAAILAVLADQPMNGYQIIQEIANRSSGVWKPSPGSIYPTLQQLEDEGLVQVETDSGGRRAYTLTDEGRAYVTEHADEVSAPWEAMSAGGAGGDDDGLKPLIGQVAAAVWQIVATGTPEQQVKGREALVELRRKLYSILAEDESAPDNGS